MLSNSSFTCLELRWVNLHQTIRRLHRTHVDEQSSLSSPTFYTPAYYPLSRTFLPHFLSRFLPVVTPASRFLPTAVVRCGPVSPGAVNSHTQ